MMKTRNKYLNHHRVIPVVLATALFMESLDSTIITIAIPQMSMALHTSVISLKNCLTSYLISLFFFIPVSGWIADKFGCKKVFSIALSIFIFSSFLCGIAQSLNQLVAARILQGMGGAFMMPVGRLILFKTFPKNELTKISNYITIPALAGPLLGPTMGGMIVSVTSWKWIFFINIPFGIIAGALTLLYLTEIKAAKILKFDFFGFLLIGSGLAGLAFSFQFYTIHYTTAPIVHYISFLSLGLLLSYCMYYRYAKHPVCNFKLLEIRSFRVGFLGMLLNRLTTSGIILILTLYLQVSLGISPLISGLVISPLAIAMMLIKFAAPRLLKSLGFKKHLFISHSLIGVSILSFALITSHTSHFIIALIVFSYGLFISLNFSALSLLSFVDLDTHNMSQGTSLIGVIQGLFNCIGIIGSSLILEGFSGSPLALIEWMSIPFQKTFCILGMLTLCSSSIFMLLKNNDGEIVSRGRKD